MTCSLVGFLTDWSVVPEQGHGIGSRESGVGIGSRESGSGVGIGSRDRESGWGSGSGVGMGIGVGPASREGWLLGSVTNVVFASGTGPDRPATGLRRLWASRVLVTWRRSTHKT